LKKDRKNNILGILVDGINCPTAVEFIMDAARGKRGASVSALAVHGLMTGVLDAEQKYRLNTFDLLLPDGQPVRWVLNWLHGVKLQKRVCGRDLMLGTCAAAAKEGLSIYFYGTTPEILSTLRDSLNKKFPDLAIAGMEPSKFRKLTPEEKSELCDRVRATGASILFAGLGCPRQETFAYEFRETLSMPILAVGAAFPFLAGMIPEAPAGLQTLGLEWLYRLCSEPRRLWRRYLYLNPAYIFLVAMQALGVKRFSTDGHRPTMEILYG
jgi:N-acetylglucosaminyldiphosphoundecaprenol N-acetyl-beta-D-mannosaminyltransferase